MSRRPSASVRRKLRQEANYGCVKCGAPILEYHHIEYYCEESHNDPERMVVLCPNCHRHAGPDAEALTKDDLYCLKENPNNGSEVSYDFKFTSQTPAILFAGNTCILEHRQKAAVFLVDNEPLVEITYKNGVLQFSATLYGESGELIAEIDNNDWVAYTDELWDLTYAPHRFKIWHEERNIGIEVEYDSEEDIISIRGNFYKRGTMIRGTESKLKLRGRNIQFSGNISVDRPVMIDCVYDEESDSFGGAFGSSKDPYDN